MSRGNVTSVSAVIPKIMTLSTHKQHGGHDQLQHRAHMAGVEQGMTGANGKDAKLSLSNMILGENDVSS